MAGTRLCCTENSVRAGAHCSFARLATGSIHPCRLPFPVCTTSHGSPLAQHHSALYPRKCGLISQLWVNKPNLQQALRARIRKQLRPLRGQGQFKKLFARFSYCCAGSSCFPLFLRGGKKSQNQFVSVTCGDPEHPVLVLGAGEGRNCFQQPGGVGGRRALCAAGGCSVHASLLNKYLFKRV